MTDAAATLARTAMFDRANPTTLTRLAGHARESTYDSGEVVFLEGAIGDAMFVVADGLVKLSCTSRNGVELLFRTVGPGGTFGELSALDGENRSAAAIALRVTRLLSIPASALRAALAGDPALAESTLLSVAAALRATSRQHADLVFLDLAGRVAAYLLGLWERSETGLVELELSQGDLAGLLGASRQSVNQVLRALEADGIVTRRKRGLAVLDPEALRARVASAPA